MSPSTTDICFRAIWIRWAASVVHLCGRSSLPLCKGRGRNPARFLIERFSHSSLSYHKTIMWLRSCLSKPQRSKSKHSSIPPCQSSIYQAIWKQSIQISSNSDQILSPRDCKVIKDQDHRWLSSLMTRTDFLQGIPDTNSRCTQEGTSNHFWKRGTATDPQVMITSQKWRPMID